MRHRLVGARRTHRAPLGRVSRRNACARGCVTAAAAALLALAGCAQLARPPAAGPAGPITTLATSATSAAPVAPPPPAVPAPPPPPSVIELSAQPAEQSLLAGLRAYEDGQYGLSEKRLGTALKIGLAAPQDRAAAYKTLAFLYCSSKRVKACEAAFRSARAADPGFALGKAETGHPVWGPAYRRGVASR